MANELKHGSVGTELTQAEWEAVGAHVFNSQAAGDILYASSTSQLTRLGKGADNTVLHLASGIPAWSATLAGLTLTTPTISSTGFANANHAHAASNSGGTISAGALSGTTLASSVVTTSATTVGALGSGSISSGFGAINNGSSTITTTGSVATGALTAGGILKTDDTTEATSTTDGSLQTDGGLSVAKDAIIGDDLRLLSDGAVFAMGAGSDFTITHDGSTAATIDIGGSGGSITNVGASGNDWTTNHLYHINARSGGNVTMYCNNTSVDAGSGAQLVVQVDHPDANDPVLTFSVAGGGESMSMGIDNSNSDIFTIADNSYDLSTNSRLRLTPAGVLSVDVAGSGSAAQVDLFDDYDDPAELRAFQLTHADGIVTREQQLQNQQRLVDIGVAEWAKQEDGPDRLMMRVQPMTRLLAGGIYQNRQRIDAQYDQIDARLTRIETALGV